MNLKKQAGERLLDCSVWQPIRYEILRGHHWVRASKTGIMTMRRKAPGARTTLEKGAKVIGCRSFFLVADLLGASQS
jgi:hypothetical protein